MRIARNRLDVDTLYVLGAGASYGLSDVQQRKTANSTKFRLKKFTTPLDKDFLRTLKGRDLATGWRKEAFSIVEKDWFDRLAIEDMGLEEAIIRRVSQYDFLNNIGSSRTSKKASNEEYLNQLSHLIAEFLSKCRLRNNLGEKFLNYVFPISEAPAKHKNRIVTFNYDLLLESLLLDRRGYSPKNLYFDRIGQAPHDEVARRTGKGFRNPLFLKMHGSIDWRCQRNYFDDIVSGAVDPNVKIPVWHQMDKTPKPDDDVSPLIIPPIPNKPITQVGLFRFLWTRAYEYLHEAKRIVVIGYSCPVTDAAARNMFAHFKNKRLEEFVVVDPDAGALQRYRLLVDPAVATKARWSYYSDVSEYIERGLSSK